MTTPTNTQHATFLDRALAEYAGNVGHPEPQCCTDPELATMSDVRRLVYTLEKVLGWRTGTEDVTIRYLQAERRYVALLDPQGEAWLYVDFAPRTMGSGTRARLVMHQYCEPCGQCKVFEVRAPDEVVEAWLFGPPCPARKMKVRD